MDTISQTALSNAFSWMKMHEFRLRFHWSLFLKFELTIFQHWFREWLGAGQATSHSLNQWWLVYWRIYASLGLNEIFRTYDGPFNIDFASLVLKSMRNALLYIFIPVLGISTRIRICNDSTTTAQYLWFYFDHLIKIWTKQKWNF